MILPRLQSYLQSSRINIVKQFNEFIQKQNFFEVCLMYVLCIFDFKEKHYAKYSFIRTHDEAIFSDIHIYVLHT